MNKMWVNFPPYGRLRKLEENVQVVLEKNPCQPHEIAMKELTPEEFLEFDDKTRRTPQIRGSAPCEPNRQISMRCNPKTKV